jgi:predicted AlkP superfamily pyrophosphatase or phosphodiesterase
VEQRLVLIVIDGLGYQTSVNHCGFLESLVHGGKARRWKMRAVLPTLSLPCYETIHAGTDPHEHGILTNDHRRLSKGPHTFGEVRAVGGRTGAVAHMNFSELYNGAPYDPLTDHEYDDEARPVQHGRFYDPAYYTKFNLGILSDRDLFTKTTLLMRRFRPNYLLVHSLCCDSVGHAYGGASTEYQTQAGMVDDQIAFFVQHWWDAGYRVMVTADHGMSADGNHGGTTDDVRYVAFYELGHPEPGEAPEIADQRAIAPTVLSRLGLKAPSSMKVASLG